GQPRLATAEDRIHLCAQCHSPREGNIPDNDPTLVRFQGRTFPRSRCYTESAGRFDCMTCHDPHADADPDHTAYEAKCLDCHGAPARPHPVMTSPVCPVNAARDCLSCHMPTVSNADTHTTFTEHHIRINREPARGGAK